MVTTGGEAVAALLTMLKLRLNFTAGSRRALGELGGMGQVIVVVPPVVRIAGKLGTWPVEQFRKPSASAFHAATFCSTQSGILFALASGLAVPWQLLPVRLGPMAKLIFKLIFIGPVGTGLEIV